MRPRTETFSFTLPEIEMLAAALHVAAVRRGFALQAQYQWAVATGRAESPEPLSLEEVVALRDRLRAALIANSG